MGRGLFPGLWLDHFRSHAGRRRKKRRLVRADGALLGLVPIRLERMDRQLRFRAPDRARPGYSEILEQLERSRPAVLSPETGRGHAAPAGARPPHRSVALFPAQRARVSNRAPDIYARPSRDRLSVRALDASRAPRRQPHRLARRIRIPRNAAPARKTRLEETRGANAAGIRRPRFPRQIYPSISRK